MTDCISNLQYKLYKTTVKTTFRVWCLYSYVVHMVQLFFFLQDNSGDQAKSGHASLGDLASSRNPVNDGDPTLHDSDPAWHAGDPARHAGDPARHAGDPARHAGDPIRHAGDPARHAGDPERSARGGSLEQPLTAGQGGGSAWNLMGLMTLKRNKKK